MFLSVVYGAARLARPRRHVPLPARRRRRHHDRDVTAGDTQQFYAASSSALPAAAATAATVRLHHSFQLVRRVLRRRVARHRRMVLVMAARNQNERGMKKKDFLKISQGNAGIREPPLATTVGRKVSYLCQKFFFRKRSEIFLFSFIIIVRARLCTAALV